MVIPAMVIPRNTSSETIRFCVIVIGGLCGFWIRLEQPYLDYSTTARQLRHVECARINSLTWCPKICRGTLSAARLTERVVEHARLRKPVSFRLTHLIFALLIWSGTANALDPKRELSQFGVEVWLTENGLPQNTVHAITQTKNGYVWIATEGGLARYDGINFRIFDRQNTPELPSNYIRALMEDRQGNLW